MTRQVLRMKLAILNKRNIDVILELRKVGIDVGEAQFSRAFSPTAREPKQDRIRRETEKIIATWEKRLKASEAC